MIEGPELVLPDPMTWVGDYPRLGAERSADIPALVFPERDVTLTYSAFEDQVRRATGLLESFGLDSGSRVAYLGKNNELFFVVLFAALRLGVIVVPLNWRCRAAEIRFFLEDSLSELLFVDAEFLPVVDEATRQVEPTPEVLLAESDGNGSGLRNRLASVEPVIRAQPWEDDAVCLQLYTSGTTGRPKGALITHRALTVSRYCEYQMPGFPDWSGSTMISAMPNFHIGGISWMLIGLARQSTCVVTTDPSPASIVRLLDEHGGSCTFAVASLIRGIVDELKRTGRKLPALETIFYGASPIGEALLREAMEALGCGFAQFFGMTEATGSVTFLAPENHDLERPERLSSVGKVLPGMALDIRDPDGKSLPAGEAGEIWAATPALMAGYWNRQETTNEVVVDGWYRTGDGGRFDTDGFVYLTDRIKDMIVSGGENIYPNEIEELLRQHPEVQDVAVVGVADDTWGEAVVAVVERPPGTAGETDVLFAFLRERLAAYKCPKRIYYRDVLPRTASGKIQRAVVRRELNALEE